MKKQLSKFCCYFKTNTYNAHCWWKL